MKTYPSKRRAISNGSLQVDRDSNLSPSRPTSHAASLPISSLRTRRSPGRPVTSAADWNRKSQNLEVTPEKLTERRGSHAGLQYHALSEPAHYRGRRSFHSDPRAIENIRPLYPTSSPARSSQQTGSPVLSTPPGSASLSQSNSSTAPIIPTHGFVRHSSSRNKLVKRSSSQKVLNGGNNMYSTLRRPATSHQRSATLQKQLYEVDHFGALTRDSSASEHSLDGRRNQVDPSPQWRPFFKAKPSQMLQITKRRFSGASVGHEALPAIVPNWTEHPTLLLATSIHASPLAPESAPGSSEQSPIQHPTMSNDFITATPAASGSKAPGSDHNVDTRPRTSFSLSDLFPSPSPLTWKMPRPRSLRNKRTLGKRVGGRRVLSAPTSAPPDRFASPIADDRALGTHTRTLAPAQDTLSTKTATQHQSTIQTSPSLPLPPLTRLSRFRLNLPETIPSYPTTPGRTESPPRSADQSSPISPSSPLSHLPRRTQAHQFSATHSDPTSTLLGSDADNSRLLSGDEDDMDGRSSTVYDSTRTGATGKSNASRKRRHIDTLFDESPPSRLPEGKLVGLEDLNFAELTLEPDSSRRQSPIGPIGLTPHSDSEDKSKTSNLEWRQKSAAHEKSKSAATYREDLDNANEMDAGSSSWKHSAITIPEAGKNRDSTASPSARSLGSAKSHVEDEGQEQAIISQKSTPRRDSSSNGTFRPSPFKWSEQSSVMKDGCRADFARPNTAQGRQTNDIRGHRLHSRRGPTPLHLRSQSVPVPSDNRAHASTNKLDTWTLRKHGPSEDWDGDFDFEEPSRVPKPVGEGMLVPKSIMDTQASVHGQFGQVKELTKLVEGLKRLQQQAKAYAIMTGQGAELWKEAEGIINLATVDDEEHDSLPPQSPSTDFDLFDEESPSTRHRRPERSPPNDDRASKNHVQTSRLPSRHSQDAANVENLPSSSQLRRESSAKAKSVLKNIHQQRTTTYDHGLSDTSISQRKLPFDTTSLKDLVTRAGVVTRALKEEVRRAENQGETTTQTKSRNEERPGTPPDPPDPPFVKEAFQKPSPSQPYSKSPRTTQSPKSSKSPQSPKSPKDARSNRLGSSISGPDTEINAHLKVMTVV